MVSLTYSFLEMLCECKPWIVNSLDFAVNIADVSAYTFQPLPEKFHEISETTE